MLRAFVVIYLLSILASLAFTVGLVWTVLHFVSKFW